MMFRKLVPNPDYRPSCHDCANCDEYGCWKPNCKHYSEYILKKQLGKLPDNFKPFPFPV